jgi:hypothetical protein
MVTKSNGSGCRRRLVKRRAQIAAGDENYSFLHDEEGELRVQSLY